MASVKGPKKTHFCLVGILLFRFTLNFFPHINSPTRNEYDTLFSCSSYIVPVYSNQHFLVSKVRKLVVPTTNAINKVDFKAESIIVAII